MNIPNPDIENKNSELICLISTIAVVCTTAIGLVLKGFLAAIVLIDTYMLLSDVSFYVGFSGLLYVIIGLAMGRMLQMKQTIRFVGLLVGVYFYMFHLSEQLHNSKDVIWHSLKQAHMLGMFAGFCIMLLNVRSE